MKKLSIVSAILALSLSSAFAADLPLKAPPLSNPFTAGYPSTCGAYYGINAQGSAETIANATPGATAIGGDIGGTLGYACNNSASHLDWFAEGQLDFQNLNGTGPGFSLTGPLHGALRAGIAAGPLLTFLPSLPNFNIPSVPSILPLPTGVTTTDSKLYVYGQINFDDVTARFSPGQSGRDWMISPEFGLENRVRLSNNVVESLWAGGVIGATKGLCIGGISCPALNTGFRTGAQFLY